MFEHNVTVRWADADAQGHINHAVFFTYLEEGRDAFYAGRLDSTAYAVVHVEADMRREARLDVRTLIVRVELERVGRTSVTTRESIVDPLGEIVVEARVVVVKWDPEARAAVPLTDGERERLGASS